MSTVQSVYSRIDEDNGDDDDEEYDDGDQNNTHAFAGMRPPVPPRRKRPLSWYC